MKSFTGALIIFILGLATGVTYHDKLLINTQSLQEIEHPQIVLHNNLEDSTPAPAPVLKANADLPKIDLCFTPPKKHCAYLIAELIDKAESSIYMQAYGLTHPEIIRSLIQAKQRGLEVKVLLDRSNLKQKYSRLEELQQAGIEVSIDVVQGIAHNKVIIIDEFKTITGSFNFTVAADTRNAENVVIIEDKKIAKNYLLNWMNRKSLNKSNRLNEEIYQ